MAFLGSVYSTVAAAIRLIIREFSTERSDFSFVNFPRTPLYRKAMRILSLMCILYGLSQAQQVVSAGSNVDATSNDNLMFRNQLDTEVKATMGNEQAKPEETASNIDDTQVKGEKTEETDGVQLKGTEKTEETKTEETTSVEPVSDVKVKGTGENTTESSNGGFTSTVALLFAGVACVGTVVVIKRRQTSNNEEVVVVAQQPPPEYVVFSRGSEVTTISTIRPSHSASAVYEKQLREEIRLSILAKQQNQQIDA